MRTLNFNLHELFNQQRRFRFPFAQQASEIPKNGIYVIFENGEKFHRFDRIVRVGTHTGDGQLRSRLNQHFVKENKNRSIFRKNIGRCMLNEENSNYLDRWELDTTSRADKERNLKLLNLDFEKQLETKISDYIQTNLSFCVFQVDTKEQRLFWESKIVSTLAKSTQCKLTENCLRLHSTREKIRISGLWQVNELYNDELTGQEFAGLRQLVLRQQSL